MNTEKQNSTNPVNFDDYARSYEGTLNASLELSGETSDYFYFYKVDCLKRWLKDVDKPYSALDFGSGIGPLTALVAQEFPHWTIYGYDVSSESIERAAKRWSHIDNLTFGATWPTQAKFDVITATNVFHHIPIDERQATLTALKELLMPGGRIVIFEHNPWNPLTRFVVRNCEFDRDAELITASCFVKLACNNGLETFSKRYIVFFPKPLKVFRPLENLLGWLPIGAQYMLIFGHTG